MKRELALRCCWLWAVILCGFGPLAQAKSTPAFWVVSDKNSQIYLLGSMHYGEQDFYPLPKEIESAYASSSHLAVEADISSLDGKVMGGLLQKYAALSDGETLKSVLGAELYARFEAFCKKNHMSVDAWQMWQPWFVAMQLVQIELTRTQWQAMLGIDLHFLMRKNKSLIELESIESQFKLFSHFSKEDQQVFFQQTLNDLDKSVEYLGGLARAWKTGDLDAMETLLVDTFDESQSGKKFHQKFFVERNQKMAAQAKDFLKQDKKVFFIVGAGHMIGEQGIVELLIKSGYKVERVKFSEQK